MDFEKANKIKSIIDKIKADPSIYNNASPDVQKRYADLITEYKTWKSTDQKIESQQPKEESFFKGQFEPTDIGLGVEAVLGREGTRLFKEGDIRYPLVAGLTAPARIVKSAISGLGSLFSDKPTGDALLESLAGRDDGILTDIAEDPSVVPLSLVPGGQIGTASRIGKYAGGIAKGAAEGIGGALTRSGLLGNDFKKEDALLETGLGAALGASGKAISDFIPYAKKMQAEKALAGRGDELVNLLETASDPLGKERLVSALKETSPLEIAKEFNKRITSPYEFLPEIKRIDSYIESMNPIDISSTVEMVDDMMIKPKTNAKAYAKDGDVFGTSKLTKSEREYNKSLKEINDVLKSNVEPTAKEAVELRRRIDDQIDYLVDENPSLEYKINKAYKKIRTDIKDKLIKSANLSGNKEYVSDMRSLADKLGKFERVKEMLPAKQDRRTEMLRTFFANPDAPSRELKREIIGDVEDIIGEDFTNLAQDYMKAKRLGLDEYGMLPMSPQQSTGKALGVIGANIFGGTPWSAANVWYPTFDKLNRFENYPLLRSLTRSAAFGGE